jgi:hypothetical protein
MRTRVAPEDFRRRLITDILLDVLTVIGIIWLPLLGQYWQSQSPKDLGASRIPPPMPMQWLTLVLRPHFCDLFFSEIKFARNFDAPVGNVSGTTLCRDDRHCWASGRWANIFRNG